jgi:hypothetical protein
MFWWMYTLVVITKMKLSNISIISQSYYFLCVARTFKIYFLSKFQVYNAVLTVVTILYIKYSELVHSAQLKWYALWSVFPYLLNTLAPGNHHPTLQEYEFKSFRLHLWMRLCLPYYTDHFHPCCCKWLGFLPSTGWLIFHCAYTH